MASEGSQEVSVNLELVNEIRRLENEIKTLHKQYGCEVRDPCGTIWDHAARVEKENVVLKAEIATLRPY